MIVHPSPLIVNNAEYGTCLLGTQEIQAFPPQAHSQGFHLAARDSEQRAQSILSLAERSDTKIMSMYKELSVKSRVRGDFHARFCERVRVKLPRSTRPMIPYHLTLFRVGGKY